MRLCQSRPPPAALTPGPDLGSCTWTGISAQHGLGSREAPTAPPTRMLRPQAAPFPVRGLTPILLGPPGPNH